MSAPSPVRIKHKTLGTVLRVIRVVPYSGPADNDAILSVYAHDETYGGRCWLPLSAENNAKWEVVA